MDKPHQIVEKQLIVAILDGTYPIDSPIPNERTLSEQLGVTRPTLREALQRLSREGWLEIRHGKPTCVRNFWKKGGLGILSTLAEHAEFLPKKFILGLLDFRETMIPTIAQNAVNNDGESILSYLKRAPDPEEDSDVFTRYDWNLQRLFGELSDNPIHNLLLNDFYGLFTLFSHHYFEIRSNRADSCLFYLMLKDTIIKNPDSVHSVVKNALEKASRNWRDMEASS